MVDVKKKRKSTPKIALSDYIGKHSIVDPRISVHDKILDPPLTSYNKIIDRLYLGNIQAAKEKKLFGTKKVKAVLNCSKDIPNYFAGKTNIEYMRLPVDDSLKEKDFELMYRLLPAAVEYIHKHVDIQKNTILIHCYAGRQRSAACVCAYLIAKHNMTPHEAGAFVLGKRPEAFHFGKSVNFDQALMKYYRDLQKCGK